MSRQANDSRRPGAGRDMSHGAAVLDHEENQPMKKGAPEQSR